MPRDGEAPTVLVAGCGSIGMRHIRNLRGLGVSKFLIAEPDAKNRARAAEEFQATIVADLETGLQQNPDLAIVAAPTNMHLAMARQSARNGTPVFVEKPLSHTTRGLDALASYVKRRRLTTMVGCNMRFHDGPATAWRLLESKAVGTIYSASFNVGFYLPDWHPDLDYRRRYSARDVMGGGIVLDGIHELDLACWFFGAPTKGVAFGGRKSDLQIDVEDCVDALLRFPGQVDVSVHLDYLQRVYSRSFRIIGSEGTIEWDVHEGVRRFSARTNKWHAVPATVPKDPNAMYRDEMRHFLDCIRIGRTPFSSIPEAARTTRLALDLRHQVRRGVSA